MFEKLHISCSTACISMNSITNLVKTFSSLTQIKNVCFDEQSH